MKFRDFPVADYSNEDPAKVLDSYSLIEAIHELFEPTCEHDRDYLLLRINLLRNFFEIEESSINSHSQTINQLITGYGQIKPLRILPFEGALEVPDSLDTEAHVEIKKQFDVDLDSIRKKTYEIQRAYITYIILHSINGRLRSRTIKLGELISLGLPHSDPGGNLDD